MPAFEMKVSQSVEDLHLESEVGIVCYELFQILFGDRILLLFRHASVSIKNKTKGKHMERIVTTSVADR
ncbi:MAG: hypothetical protein WAL71_09325 [Terriglobales bacterium]|jgi:hypothetical protein